MNTASIFLPWPSKVLSPNARVHWGALATAKKKAKRDAYYAVIDAGIGKIEADSITVRVSFYPPDRRARDLDNLISSQKAGFDGIAQAIGIDDSKWAFEIGPKGPVERNGMVKIELIWASGSAENKEKAA